MKRYVVGFMFNPVCDRVVLIQKARPAWQAGKLNGVGGHINDGEDPLDAMQREFSEEAGVSCRQWQEFARMEAEGVVVHAFRTFQFRYTDVRTMTDELIGIYFVPDLSPNALPNLRWLIPLALDGSVDFTVVKIHDAVERFRHQERRG